MHNCLFFKVTCAHLGYTREFISYTHLFQDQEYHPLNDTLLMNRIDAQVAQDLGSLSKAQECDLDLVFITRNNYYRMSESLRIHS